MYTAGVVYICRAYIEEAGGGSVQPSGRDSTLAPTVDALSILAAEKGDDDDAGPEKCDEEFVVERWREERELDVIALARIRTA